MVTFFHTSQWPVGQIYKKNAFDEARNPVGKWPARLYVTLYNMSDAFIDVVKPEIENQSNAFWLHGL